MVERECKSDLLLAFHLCSLPFGAPARAVAPRHALRGEV
ncbi:Hypothetical protein A7982_03439 [Minicystis rosea]|nr:Hypothetical protein A7982_03439 [Minicystis rosea]